MVVFPKYFLIDVSVEFLFPKFKHSIKNNILIKSLCSNN